MTPRPTGPVCLPVRLLKQPRTRWDHRLRMGEFPGADQHGLMVCADEPRELDTAGMVIAGNLAPSVVAAIVTTMRRAAESERTEARFRL